MYDKTHYKLKKINKKRKKERKALEGSGRKRLVQTFLVHRTNWKQREGVQTWQEIQAPTPLNDEGKCHACDYTRQAQLAPE